MRARILVAAALCVPLCATSALAGNPWEQLMGREKPNLWQDPDGRFAIDLPVNWRAHHREGAPVVEFTKRHPDNGAFAKVAVEMRAVPPGVRVSHFALKVNREVQAAAPTYRLMGEDKFKVSGTTARRTHFTYQERGNAQLTNEVVQIIFITGERAWIISLMTAYGARGIFWEDFGLMVKGFNANGPSEVYSGKKKGKRKRLRAGEMVNPDMLEY